MTDFRRLSPTMLASPQIDAAQVRSAKDHGVTLIINNRPDGEAPEEPQGAEIESAAHAAGLDYVAIPVGHSGFGDSQITAMRDALASAEGTVLAYCRSGTRSTFLWSLAQASEGKSPQDIAAAAQDAGYDITPIRSAMDILAGQAGN